MQCSFGCNDCRNEDFCRECRDPYLRFVSEDNQVAECVLECPDGFVGDEDGECVEEDVGTPICGLRCADCEDRFYCNECEEGFFKFEFDDGNRSRCLVRCPVGFEPDRNNECVEEVTPEPECGRGCLECVDEDFCEICDEDFLLFVEEDGMSSRCVRRCPRGYVPHDNFNECVPEEDDDEEDNCNPEICQRCS